MLALLISSLLLGMSAIYALHEYAKCKEQEQEMKYLESVLYRAREYEPEEEKCSRS